MPTDSPTVVRIGPLMPNLTQTLQREYDAPRLDETTGELPTVRIAVPSGRTAMGAAEMDRLPGLRAITNFGVGYDKIDIAEASRRGIAVSNTPDVLTDCVADTAVGLVIDVMRGLSAADRFVRRGDWLQSRYPLARRVSGASVGILGLGRIGRAIAHRLEAFDARISYCTRRRRDDVSYDYVADPVELARTCDVLVVAAAGGPDSAGLVDATVLDALGPQGYLINIARGSIVDETALVAALAERRIAGAGLDVFADEPRVPEALLARDDVVLLPHVGSGTEETRRAMGELVLANIRSHLESGTLITPVN